MDNILLWTSLNPIYTSLIVFIIVALLLLLFVRKQLLKSDDTIIKDQNYILYKENEEFKKGKFDSNGKIEEKDIIPGKYSILIKTKDE